MLLWLSSGDFAGFGVHFYQVIDLADYLAFQAADDVAFGFSFGGATGYVGDSWFMESHADDDCAVDCRVELAVPTMIDAVFSAGHARSGPDATDADKFRERGLGLDSLGGQSRITLICRNYGSGLSI